MIVQLKNCIRIKCSHRIYQISCSKCQEFYIGITTIDVYNLNQGT